jgi:hypothetical protein
MRIEVRANRFMLLLLSALFSIINKLHVADEAKILALGSVFTPPKCRAF